MPKTICFSAKKNKVLSRKVNEKVFSSVAPSLQPVFFLKAEACPLADLGPTLGKASPAPLGPRQLVQPIQCRSEERETVIETG